MSKKHLRFLQLGNTSEKLGCGVVCNGGYTKFSCRLLHWLRPSEVVFTGVALLCFYRVYLKIGDVVPEIYSELLKSIINVKSKNRRREFLISVGGS